MKWINRESSPWEQFVGVLSSTVCLGEYCAASARVDKDKVPGEE
jgi:hypothetical protein